MEWLKKVSGVFVYGNLATITKINDDCWMWKVGQRGGSETTSFAAQQAAEKAMKEAGV